MEVVTVEEFVAEDAVTFVDAADKVAMAEEYSGSKSNIIKYQCTAHK